MADVMAIISKAVFEKIAGKAPVLGTVLGIDRYTSANKNLEPIAGGGRLFLVTVRPPNEALWLVAVLEKPKFDGSAWVAKPSSIEITDISKHRGALKFESGKGITADPGALGMSLQTPRLLTSADAALLSGGPAPVDPNAKLMTGDRERKHALIEAILADPDGDLPRQVYADERAIHQDPRGELILIELALAKPMSIRKRAQLRARRTELLAEHGATWFAYKLAKAGRRRGGFLCGVSGTLAQLGAEELFASQPITDVTVLGIDDAAAAKKLVKAPWLPRVRRLVVRGALGDEGFATLASAPAAQQLESLNVTANQIKSPVLGSYLPRCRLLSFTGNALGDRGLAELAKWTHLPQAETLYLSKCNITPKGLAALLAVSLPGLVKLCLSSNPLEDDAADVIIANARHVPNLKRLELKYAQVTTDLVEKLMKTKALHLSLLDVRVNGLANQVSGFGPRVRG